MHLNFSSPHLQVWARLKAAALEVDAEFHSMIEAAEAEAHKLFVEGEPYPHLAPGPAVMAPVPAFVKDPGARATEAAIQANAPQPQFGHGAEAENEKVAYHASLPPTPLAVGTTGVFYPHAGSGAPVNAIVNKVWSSSCVNLDLVGGGSMTSVFVLDPLSTEVPQGYYFVPGAVAPEPVVSMTTDAVASLATTPLEALSTGELIAMKTTEVASLSTSDIPALSSTEIPAQS